MIANTLDWTDPTAVAFYPPMYEVLSSVVVFADLEQQVKHIPTFVGAISLLFGLTKGHHAVVVCYRFSAIYCSGLFHCLSGTVSLDMMLCTWILRWGMARVRFSRLVTCRPPSR